MPHPFSRNLCETRVGQKFRVGSDEYELGGKLGDGAAGLVRKVRRIQDDMELAVKFLAPDPKYIDEDVFDDVAARFRREGQRGPQLRHQGLVTVHAYEENTNGSAFAGGCPKNPFILMEIVKGRTLEDFIKKVQSSNAI